MMDAPQISMLVLIGLMFGLALLGLASQ